MLVIRNKKARPQLDTTMCAGLPEEAPLAGAALYVDTENLQGNAQNLIEAAIEVWPDGKPPVRRLNLYVKADRAMLWDVWASCQFPKMTITVKGIQHFTKQATKNSADMSIAVDAVADFVTGKAKFVAIMSDDSDFVPVFAKLKDFVAEKAPFLWMVTDRATTLSPVVEDFIPSDHIQVLQMPRLPAEEKAADDEGGSKTSDLEEVASFIIERVPVGIFKSTDCQPLINERWPNHALAGLPSARFGSEFASRIWPILEERGITRQDTKPRKYELTEKVKKAR